MAEEQPDAEVSTAGQTNEHAFKVLGIAAVLLLGTATVVYRVAEDWSWVDSFYFSAVAVTTVGFRDLTPTTDASKLFTVFYIFSGIGVIAAYLNLRFTRISARIAGRRRVHSDPFERLVGEILLQTEVDAFDRSDRMPQAVGTGTFWERMVYFVQTVDTPGAIQIIEAGYEQ